ncbi:MAG TPA: hypothetical protein DDY78_05105 [Planctomycetales bacterium]|jgi:hypothetical protein|nr:hypothetical protein [Planctomycetales bacterium]
MNAEPTTVLGTLKPDGALELDEKLSLPAGRVRVTVEPLAASAATEDPFMARMEAIWAGQKARGHTPRTAEEIETERRVLRDEFEEGVLKSERIHQEAERVRRGAGQGEEPFG